MLNDDFYWNERVKMYGHTGWSDFAIYYYDQNLRLKAVRNILAGLKFTVALDYGCGTGEFSRMLRKCCDKVVATDISKAVIDKALAVNNIDGIEYRLLEESIFEYKYDLILSITVLQHITDDDLLVTLIDRFKSCLKPSGKLILLESFSSSGTQSSYIKLREFRKVVELFEGTGLTLLSTKEFYHPIYLPTESFKTYRSNLIVGLLNKLCLYGITRAGYFLKLMAQHSSEKDDGIITAESITKIMILGIKP